jgi:hypothetical protein
MSKVGDAYFIELTQTKIEISSCYPVSDETNFPEMPLCSSIDRFRSFLCKVSNIAVVSPLFALARRRRLGGLKL